MYHTYAEFAPYNWDMMLRSKYHTATRMVQLRDRIYQHWDYENTSTRHTRNMRHTTTFRDSAIRDSRGGISV